MVRVIFGGVNRGILGVRANDPCLLQGRTNDHRSQDDVSFRRVSFFAFYSSMVRTRSALTSRCIMSNEYRLLRTTNRFQARADQYSFYRFTFMFNIVVRRFVLTSCFHSERCRFVFLNLMTSINRFSAIRRDFGRRVVQLFRDYFRDQLGLFLYFCLYCARTKATNVKLSRTERTSFYSSVFITSAIAFICRRKFDCPCARSLRMLIWNRFTRNRYEGRRITNEVEGAWRFGVSLRSAVLSQDSISNSVNGIKCSFLSVVRRARIVLVRLYATTIKGSYFPTYFDRFRSVRNVFILVSGEMSALYAFRKSSVFE